MKSIAPAILLAATLGSGSAIAAPSHAAADAQALFTRFIAAQNAHDTAGVKSMLWNSADMLAFSRGVETRGTDAVAARFQDYYKGTWHLDPDMTKYHAAVMTDRIVQVLVPITFTRGLPGAKPQSDVFLISQTYVKEPGGWRVASIMPIANTQLK
jgi:hypothetical protein